MHAALIVGLAMLLGFLAAAGCLMRRGQKVSGALLALGAFGWFLPVILPATGNLLRHVELPAFYETAAIAGPGGATFTLTQPLARLQHYDAAGDFERGWFVDSKGGTVSIAITTEGKIAVAAARTRHVEFFNPDGSSAGSPRPFTRGSKDLMSGYLQPAEYRVDGVTFETPTAAKAPSARWNTLLLFPLWNPVLAWLLAAGAIAGTWIERSGKSL